MPMIGKVGGYNVISTIDDVGHPQCFLHLCIEEVLETVLNSFPGKPAPSKVVMKPKLVFPKLEKEEIILENGMRIITDKATGGVKSIRP